MFIEIRNKEEDNYCPLLCLCQVLLLGSAPYGVQLLNMDENRVRVKP